MSSAFYPPFIRKEKGNNNRYPFLKHFIIKGFKRHPLSQHPVGLFRKRLLIFAPKEESFFKNC
ncbi:hypothetical protein JN06_01573 [Bacteroides zoogleoformans]|nr:hypothetical protein JN06_01573 [Bacteroides zoogleoformans]